MGTYTGVDLVLFHENMIYRSNSRSYHYLLLQKDMRFEICRWDDKMLLGYKTWSQRNNIIEPPLEFRRFHCLSTFASRFTYGRFKFGIYYPLINWQVQWYFTCINDLYSRNLYYCTCNMSFVRPMAMETYMTYLQRNINNCSVRLSEQYIFVNS